MGMRIGCLLMTAWAAGIPVLLWVVTHGKPRYVEQCVKITLGVLLLAAIGSILHGAVRGSRAVLDAVNRTNCLNCGYALQGVARAHATVCPECGATAPSYQHDRTFYQPQDPER